jgi:hypothetical protein
MENGMYRFYKDEDSINLELHKYERYCYYLKESIGSKAIDEMNRILNSLDDNDSKMVQYQFDFSEAGADVTACLIVGTNFKKGKIKIELTSKEYRETISIGNQLDVRNKYQISKSIVDSDGYELRTDEYIIEVN